MPSQPSDPSFLVGEHRYRIIGKLNAIQQLHIVRRLSPLMSCFGSVDLVSLRPALPGEVLSEEERAATEARSSAELQKLLGPLTEGIAKLTDGDTEYVLGACMSLIERDLGGGTGWSPVYSKPGKAMMYDDIGFVELLQLMGRVLMANLGNFGSALSQIGAGAGSVRRTG